MNKTTPSQKISLNKFKRMEVIQNISSDQNGIKLEITNRKTWKISMYLELKCTSK
jgi:hypothetical protein